MCSLHDVVFKSQIYRPHFFKVYTCAHCMFNVIVIRNGYLPGDFSSMKVVENCRWLGLDYTVHTGELWSAICQLSLGLIELYVVVLCHVEATSLWSAGLDVSFTFFPWPALLLPIKNGQLHAGPLLYTYQAGSPLLKWVAYAHGCSQKYVGRQNTCWTNWQFNNTL